MTPTSTLAELATSHPAASRVFQRYGLDYCCGGRKRLADICGPKGLDPATILQAIEAEEASVDLPRWDHAPLPDLIQFIVDRYHQALRAELPALVALAARVEARHHHNPACPKGLHGYLQQMYEGVADHLTKEERVLFPMITEGYGQRAAGPVRIMEAEHDEHGLKLARLRELTDHFTPPPDACPTWRALYLRLAAFERELMDHIHLENHVLFPRALEAANGSR